jgi:hypothetical protein
MGGGNQQAREGRFQVLWLKSLSPAGPGIPWGKAGPFMAWVSNKTAH